MLFRYDKTLEWSLHPTQPLAEERSPAWQVLCLVRELDRWFDLPHRTLYQSGDARIQIGYLDASLPVAEYGEEFGTLLAGIGNSGPYGPWGPRSMARWRDSPFPATTAC